jgi:hypothetical protein
MLKGDALFGINLLFARLAGAQEKTLAKLNHISQSLDLD